MVKILDKIIFFSFLVLFFVIPLILFPKTSEIFEFNKMVATYVLTTIILAAWISRMIFEKRIRIKKTVLDIPILIFLISQTFSTVFSIDPRTSLLGYYSRFNGSLVSLISYSVLYWAYVSNMNIKKTKKVLFAALISTLIVCFIGILEHFKLFLTCVPINYQLGIQKFSQLITTNCWGESVDIRIFSTFGQPNWLAAWIAAVIPLTWTLGTYNLQFTIYKQLPNPDLKKLKALICTTISLLFFTTLLFTKSRSGILGFITADLFFFSAMAYLKMKNVLKTFFILNFLFLIFILLLGTPWNNGIFKDIKNRKETAEILTNSTVLETNEPGTSTVEIRKIVWQGALSVWKAYPIFGSGVETFAHSYYNFRPLSANLTTEWDFLYNKAHNEYLNFAANTGTVGFSAYLILIFSTLKLFRNNLLFSKLKSSNDNLEFRICNLAFMAGWISILITNFFGFSVVPISLLFFLLPAMAISTKEQTTDNRQHNNETKFNIIQKLSIGFVLCSLLYVLTVVCRYWYSDYLYTSGINERNSGNLTKSTNLLLGAIKISPHEAVFWNTLSGVTADSAINYFEKSDQISASKLAIISKNEADKATRLSPNNVAIKKIKAGTLIRLSQIDPKYLVMAADEYNQAIKLAPTDPKLYFNYSLIFFRTGNINEATKLMKKTIEMKPDYKEAIYALSLMNEEMIKGETKFRK